MVLSFYSLVLRDQIQVFGLDRKCLPPLSYLSLAHAWTFMWVCGHKLRSSSLCGKHYIDRSVSPDQELTNRAKQKHTKAKETLLFLTVVWCCKSEPGYSQPPREGYGFPRWRHSWVITVHLEPRGNQQLEASARRDQSRLGGLLAMECTQGACGCLLYTSQLSCRLENAHYAVLQRPGVGLTPSNMHTHP